MAKSTYNKEYYEKNREKILSRRKETGYMRRYYTEHKEKMNVNNKGHYQEYRKEEFRLNKLKIISQLGGKCENCGVNDSRLLGIHHINGKIKGQTKAFWKRRLINNRRSSLLPVNLEELKLLCANCHLILHDGNRENMKFKKKKYLKTR